MRSNNFGEEKYQLTKQQNRGQIRVYNYLNTGHEVNPSDNN